MKELKANMNAIKSFLTEEERKEYNKEYMKEYQETNKEIIKENKREKVTCSCGCKIVKYDLKRHERTNKHMDLIN